MTERTDTPDITELHPLELWFLSSLKKSEFSLESLEGATPLKSAQLNQAISFLRAREALEEVAHTNRVLLVATERAQRAYSEGLPERTILEHVAQWKGGDLEALITETGLEQAEAGSAFGRLVREKLITREKDGSIVLSRPPVAENWVTQLEALIAQGVTEGAIDLQGLDAHHRALLMEQSKKRGSGALFRRTEQREVRYRLSAVGEKLQRAVIASGMDGSEAGVLTPEMLRDGSWKERRFRHYNIRTPPSRVLLGRPNPYGEYLRWVKDKLVALGFEEFDGPLVETEFWNCDALYMPQFHSARDTHDVYRVAEPQYAHEIEEPYLSRVASTHHDGGDSESRGWRYPFDTQFTKRLILRSQGTALSARQLPTARVPGKYFGIVRCFRYDQVDATHLSDFYQTEGIVLGEDVNLRTLLGLLQLFAEEIAGAREVRYVPGYFPFTEPSIEVHIKHPTLGWFELGGSGIFRPEVTHPLGVTVPVLAWGLGIDRMALMKLGLSDLRELFGVDLEKTRLRVASQ